MAKYKTEPGFENGWRTDAAALAKAIWDFERALPGFWWSVGQCSVGAHASCAVDGKGAQAALLNGVTSGHPFDEGFHCDTTRGTPAEALRNVMNQATTFIRERTEACTTAVEVSDILVDASAPDDVRASAAVIMTWLAKRKDVQPKDEK